MIRKFQMKGISFIYIRTILIYYKKINEINNVFIF